MGRRVLLRPPRPGDAAEFTRLARASRGLHHGWAAPPRRRADFSAYARRARDPRHAPLLVIRRRDGALLGAINISEIVRGNFQCAYVGYHVFAAHAGQGYMTEALRLALRHAFGMLRLHRVEANIQPGNAASIALARRAGFRREGFSPRYLRIGGRWRDHERWAVVRETWVRPSFSASPS